MRKEYIRRQSPVFRNYEIILRNNEVKPKNFSPQTMKITPQNRGIMPQPRARRSSRPKMPWPNTDCQMSPACRTAIPARTRSGGSYYGLAKLMIDIASGEAGDREHATKVKRVAKQAIERSKTASVKK